MPDRFHGRIPCPEPDDPCAVCERAINAAESDRAGYDHGMSDLAADRYERNVLGQ